MLDELTTHYKLTPAIQNNLETTSFANKKQFAQQVLHMTLDTFTRTKNRAKENLLNLHTLSLARESLIDIMTHHPESFSQQERNCLGFLFQLADHFWKENVQSQHTELSQQEFTALVETAKNEHVQNSCKYRLFYPGESFRIDRLPSQMNASIRKALKLLTQEP